MVVLGVGQGDWVFPLSAPFLFDIPSLTSTGFIETKIRFPEKIQLTPSHCSLDGSKHLHAAT